MKGELIAEVMGKIYLAAVYREKQNQK